MPSKRLNEYIAADKVKKEAEATMEFHKPYIRKLLRRAKRFGLKIPGAGYSEATKFEFNEDKLLEWAKNTLDEETLKLATKTIVTYEGLYELYVSGIIKTNQIPKECYSTTISPVVRITHKEKNK